MPRAPRVPSAPAALSKILTIIGTELPEGDQLRIAARYRLDKLRAAAADDTSKLAELLGVHVRTAQRLRVAYGIEREPGFVAATASRARRARRSRR